MHLVSFALQQRSNLFGLLLERSLAKLPIKKYNLTEPEDLISKIILAFLTGVS